MKEILLLRHGKSDWDADYGADHDRPLAPRGIKAAKRVGRLLADSGKVPDAVFSSTAVRARTTVELAAEEGDWDVDIQLRRDLYGAGVRTILALARGLDDGVNSVLFVGHQPGWGHAAEVLSGGGAVEFPTACLARIAFDADRWSDVAEGEGTLIQLVAPKYLD
ncbi:MAG: histidine phosphatase family protein [Rhodothermales bacterium]|nr:histidine phosphatase family protein [Rhodothermales bacterium]